jgi:photosystem II stability/assembly factor-like uncharacterized protein
MNPWHNLVVLGVFGAFAPVALAQLGGTYALTIDPNIPARIYAGSDSGFLISTDGGSTWLDSNVGLPTGKVAAIAVLKTNPTTIYVGSGQVYKSTDAGQTWAPTGALPPTIATRAKGVAALAIDPTNPANLYAGMYANKGPGLMISKNGGATWTVATSKTLPPDTFSAIVVDPRSPSTVYAACYNGGVFKSSDGGTNWTSISSGLPGTRIHALAMDPNNSLILYTRVRDHAVYKTTNAGTTWAAANKGLGPSVDVQAQFSSVVVDPTNSSIVYTGTQAGGVFKSTDSGANWAPVGSGLPFDGGGSLAVDPTNPSTLYASTSTEGQILKSTDGGATFNVGPFTTSLPYVGSFAQVVSAGTWKMIMNFLNLGPNPAEVQASFASDSGAPLLLPFTFPQQAPAAPLLASSLDRTIAPGAQLILESTGPDTTPTSIGWGQMSGESGANGFGIFVNAALGWNALVPLETRNSSAYILAFDNTAALATGVALANVAGTAASIPVTIFDDTGKSIGTDVISLAASGHTSFVLKDKYAATVNKRGTIQFQTPAGGQISVLGLRANGPALTTLPVLADVDTSGGSFAHVTYNNGFTSTFYIVNTGSTTANFTLSFFEETTGNPLQVPLSLPQSGTTTTTATLTKTLAPGAMLVATTIAQDTAPGVSGFAQLTTTGNVSGLEVFRWNTFAQEASVPLDNRAPGSFVFAFDDTGNLTTGVAIANASATPANIQTKIYDDTGKLLQTTAINLVGHGHSSFLLPTNYPLTAGKRGLVEFFVPAGGQLSVIGIRTASGVSPIPITTIPVLTR